MTRALAITTNSEGHHVLSEITFYDDSELPSINYDYMVFFDKTLNYQLKLRACGVNGVIFADNEDPTKFISLAGPSGKEITGLRLLELVF